MVTASVAGFLFQSEHAMLCRCSGLSVGLIRVLYGFYQGSVRDSGFCFRASSKSPECREHVYSFTAQSVRITSATKCFGLTAQFPNKNPHWLADSQEERSQDTRKASDPPCGKLQSNHSLRDQAGLSGPQAHSMDSRQSLGWGSSWMWCWCSYCILRLLSLTQPSWGYYSTGAHSIHDMAWWKNQNAAIPPPALIPNIRYTPPKLVNPLNPLNP